MDWKMSDEDQARQDERRKTLEQILVVYHAMKPEHFVEWLRIEALKSGQAIEVKPATKWDGRKHEDGIEHD